MNGTTGRVSLRFCAGRDATNALEMVEAMQQMITTVQWHDLKAVNQWLWRGPTPFSSLRSCTLKFGNTGGFCAGVPVRGRQWLRQRKVGAVCALWIIHLRSSQLRHPFLSRCDVLDFRETWAGRGSETVQKGSLRGHLLWNSALVLSSIDTKLCKRINNPFFASIEPNFLPYVYHFLSCTWPWQNIEQFV